MIIYQNSINVKQKVEAGWDQFLEINNKCLMKMIISQCHLLQKLKIGEEAAIKSKITNLINSRSKEDLQEAIMNNQSNEDHHEAIMNNQSNEDHQGVTMTNPNREALHGEIMSNKNKDSHLEEIMISLLAWENLKPKTEKATQHLTLVMSVKRYEYQNIEVVFS